MAVHRLGSVEFVDVDGNLVRQDDYFDDATGTPSFTTTVLRKGFMPIVQEEKLGTEYRRDPMTGATIKVERWRNRYGKIEESHTVHDLNDGSNGEGEARWGRDDGEW